MSQFTHAAPRLYLRARGLHVFRLLLIGIIVLITSGTKYSSGNVFTCF